MALLPQFLRRNGSQDHLHAAQGDHVAVIHRLDTDLLAVDGHIATGADIRHRPAAVVIVGQNRMVTGDSGKIHHNIRAPGTADNILPMGHGELTAVGHHQPTPDLRLTTETN